MPWRACPRAELVLANLNSNPNPSLTLTCPRARTGTPPDGGAERAYDREEDGEYAQEEVGLSKEPSRPMSTCSRRG